MYGFNFQLLVFIYRNRFQAKVLKIQLAIVCLTKFWISQGVISFILCSERLWSSVCFTMTEDACNVSGSLMGTKDIHIKKTFLCFLCVCFCSHIVLVCPWNSILNRTTELMPRQNIGVLKKKSIWWPLILLTRLCRIHRLLHINTVTHQFWHCCFSPTIFWLLFPECILFPHEYNISFAAPPRPTRGNLSLPLTADGKAVELPCCFDEWPPELLLFTILFSTLPRSLTPSWVVVPLGAELPAYRRSVSFYITSVCMCVDMKE